MMIKNMDYRKLMRHWMQFYEIPAERSKEMLASILARVQDEREKKTERGEEKHGDQME